MEVSDPGLQESTVDAATVSVVVPVRNVAATIAEQVEALAGQDLASAWEIVVADHGSTDATAQVVRALLPRYPMLRLVDTAGASTVNEVRNLGIQVAYADRIALCDGDDVVSASWLRHLLDALDGFDLVGGALETRHLNPDGVPIRPEPVTDRLPVVMDFLPYAWGGNCAFRRSLWESLGGFDASFPSGGTDQEFSWRAQLAGYRLGFAPEAVVHYRYRQGLWNNARQYERYIRSQPLRYRRFRHAGLRRSSLREAARAWAWLLLRSPWVLRGDERQEQWIRQAALRVGRLLGSLRWRVLYL